jgi:thioredoxin reductase
MSAPTPGVRLRTDIVVIGAGQAGLSSAYHLKRRGLAPNRGFVVLDQSPNAGGAWQFRWPSLTLSTVNRIHDLPGMPFSAAVDTGATEAEAAIAVPRYFAAYEKEFELPVYRPVKVTVVCDRGDRLHVETDRIEVSARGIINATGTWETPYIPEYPGAERFAGRQLHTRDYRTAAEFVGQHVIIVGGGISAIQLLDEISRVTTTTWVTRRPPEFRTGPFNEEAGRAAVAMVEDRVRHGLPPLSVVSVTGLPVTPAIEAMRARGVLQRLPMFSEITPEGIRWGRRDEHACGRDSLVHGVPQLTRPSGAAAVAGAQRRHRHDRPPGDAGREGPADSSRRLRAVRVHDRREPRRRRSSRGVDGVPRHRLTPPVPSGRDALDQESDDPGSRDDSWFRDSPPPREDDERNGTDRDCPCIDESAAAEHDCGSSDCPVAAAVTPSTNACTCGFVANRRKYGAGTTTNR